MSSQTKNYHSSDNRLVVAIVFIALFTTACGEAERNSTKAGSSAPRVPLNDTGVSFYIDQQNQNGSPMLYVLDPTRFPNTPNLIPGGFQPSGFEGQDAFYGNDPNSINADFDGKLGFRFTKLDKFSSGVLDPNTTDFGCVKDEVTGLYWEHKTTGAYHPIDNLHSASAKFNWYNPDANTNGGFAGQLANDSICVSPILHSDTYTFINAVNTERLCGFSDWRLPTIEELRSIIDYNQTKKSQINSAMTDQTFFPNVAATEHRWTSQTLGTDVTKAFGFHMHEGFVQPHNKVCVANQGFTDGILLVRADYD